MMLSTGDRVQLKGEKWTAKATLLLADYQLAGNLTTFETKDDKDRTSFTVMSDGTAPFLVSLKVKKICRVYGVLGNEENINNTLGERITTSHLDSSRIYPASSWNSD